MSATTANYMPRGLSLSAVLHVLAIGALIFVAWWSQRIDQKQDTVFEVVVGPGDDYAATQAPTTTREVAPSVNVDLPEPLPKFVPPKPKPKPVPVQQRPIEQAPEPAPPKIEPAPEKPALKIEPAPTKVSYKDFTQDHPAPKTRTVKAPPAIKPKTIDMSRFEGDIEVISEGAGGTAMTANEVSMSKRYVAMIVERIRDALERQGINDVRDAGVRFSVSVRGEISDARITRSSGSSTFDRAVLSALQNIPAVGSPPTKRAEVFQTVIRLTEG
ncbi:TonB family protein [Opitutaceae bacterium]|nr:TonB family protein [Opitutaceae bacterium]MDB4474672.1 TonB family protein [Opitutaceae bacterium]